MASVRKWVSRSAAGGVSLADRSSPSPQQPQAKVLDPAAKASSAMSLARVLVQSHEMSGQSQEEVPAWIILYFAMVTRTNVNHYLP